jgi:hypothetical protein
MNKEKESTNVKADYEFDNDLVKMCFEHKTRMSHRSCDFLWNLFFYDFLMFGHAHIFSSFIVICTHLKCYTTSDVQLITCALCEKKKLKKLMDQKMKKIIILNVFPMFFFWVKNCFDVF